MNDPNGGSWKLSLPCSRGEAETLAGQGDPFADLATPPVLMTREPDPARPEDWLLEAFFDAEPDGAMIDRVRALVPSASQHAPHIDYIAAQDWVTLSQAGLEPVLAGRFFVHDAAHRALVPPGATSFQIEAGLAFGTGQHQTTTGCLLALDGLARMGKRFHDIADIGTGTGLLAFAAQRLWPRARLIASDIDPVAIAVTRENAELNNIVLGDRPGALALVVAAGLGHRQLRRGAPYDLIIANILAGPLITLAPVLAGALAPGGTLLLAGLLDSQAEGVAAAYRPHGLRLAQRIDRDEWPTLRLVNRRIAARPIRPG